MKPASFHYTAPRSEDELLVSLGEYGGDSRLLAGGQSLVPMMNFRVATPSVLIDINRLSSLSYIDVGAQAVEIGALTRHAMLEDSVELRARLALVGEAVSYLAHRAIRNRGTLGGSLALAYPNAELPLLLVALGGELHLRSPRGERSVPMANFIEGPLFTVLGGDEYIRSARIPLPGPAAGTAFVEISRRHGDFALAAAAAVVDLEADGTIGVMHAAISGGQGCPLRLLALERTLTGEKPAAERIEDAVRSTIDGIDVDDDRDLPVGYRRLLLTTVLQRALQSASERAGAPHAH
jgi:carbon-monoxide dehydrogenase medium subunit